MEHLTREDITGVTETQLCKDINNNWLKTGEEMYERLKTEKMRVVFDTMVYLNQRYKAAYAWAAHKIIEERTRPKD